VNNSSFTRNRRDKLLDCHCLTIDYTLKRLKLHATRPFTLWFFFVLFYAVKHFSGCTFPIVDRRWVIIWLVFFFSSYLNEFLEPRKRYIRSTHNVMMMKMSTRDLVDASIHFTVIYNFVHQCIITTVLSIYCVFYRVCILQKKKKVNNLVTNVNLSNATM
jgi:hypothetical protein